MSRSALDSLLFDAEGPRVGLVLAPNYEARSALGPAELLRDRQLSQRVDVHLWTLRSKRTGVAPLESLKKHNIEAVKGALKAAQSSRPKPRVIAYPEEFNLHSVAKALDSVLELLPEQGRVVIDISTMPRRLLAAIMRWRSSAFVKYRAVEGLVILYAWARGYAHHPSEEGDWRLLETGQRLDEALEGLSGRKQCLLVCGRQGFDAASFADSLGDNVSARAYVVLSSFNLSHSFEVLRANLHTLRSREIPLRYCFDIATGHERLMEWATSIPTEDGGAYILAPFGPKPLVLSSILAADALRARLAEAGCTAAVGLATLGGHRYTNVYSLGFAGWEALEGPFFQSEPSTL